jgi:carbonic anhydrase/acetyltransferase-like protein (isoleucine patch superfamily)
MPLYALDGRAPDVPAQGRYFIAPDAHVIGAVRLGDEVGVWFGAVLRGDCELIDVGDRSNIQEGCVLHTDPGFSLTIGEDCTIGHRAILHGCRIGRNSLVGMGATLLNGVVLGEGCLVGANALLTEGKEFPARSLIVGCPGKVVRTLDDEAYAAITRSARHYVQNWRRFAAGLIPVAPAC